VIATRIYKKIKLFLLMNNYNTFPNYFKNVDEINLSPIFIIGGNRSGTSLISSLISQHHQVEGIFENSEFPKLSKYGKHVLAYCTSHHVWNFLVKMKSNWTHQDEGVLWGHPKNISKYYIDKPRNAKQSLILANAIQFFRKTEKTPLLNSHYNMFRVGMIKKIFPNAKFILIIKDYNEIITSCYDKWEKQKINIEYPKIGLHWFTTNSCCLYDLKKYASADYCVIEFAELFNKEEKTIKMLNNKLENIGLDKFSYDLDIIKPEHRFIESKNSKQFNFEKYFGWIENIIDDESKITNT